MSRDPAPNLVAYSAGAVCCPDEKSARAAGTRATWQIASRVIEWSPLPGLFSLRSRFPTRRRWTS